MISDAANQLSTAKQPRADAVRDAMQTWQHQPCSILQHHQKDCCERARLWLLAMDGSMRGADAAQTGPRWIRGRYNWGPSVWPLYWCEAIGRSELDCGALAWMTLSVYEARQVSGLAVQLVQVYNDDASAQWETRWQAAGASTHWLTPGFMYHEACAIIGDGQHLRIWDPSSGSWMGPAAGYGGIAAVRILDPLGICEHQTYHWGGHALSLGQWHPTLNAPSPLPGPQREAPAATSPYGFLATP